MHAFTSVMDASSSLLQSVRAAADASMDEITFFGGFGQVARFRSAHVISYVPGITSFY